MMPLKDLFQKEIYRMFYALVDVQAVISPGFELVRSNSKLSEYLQRFQPGGTYHSLITPRLMTEYLVLNFTTRI